MMSWEYIAGFFDGEGHAALRTASNGAAWFAGIGQSGKEGKQILEEIQEFLRIHGINSNLHADSHKGKFSKRDMYRLTLSNRINVVGLLKKLIPFVHVKKATVQDILRYDILYPRWTSRERGLILNRRWEKTVLVRSKNGNPYRISKEVWGLER
jgi:hypothetical protein